MSEPIPFAAVKHDALLSVEGTSETDIYKLSLSQGDDAVLALVEVAEAARVLTSRGFGRLDEREFYAVRESLNRFDFETTV